MPHPVFRPAGSSDLDTLLPVVRQFYVHFGFAWGEARKRARLAELIARPDLGRCWVAVEGDRVLGYALVAFYFSLEFDGRVALVDELFLTAETRGRGLGGGLLGALFEAFDREGVCTVRLELDARHPEAAGLYARNGFVRDGREAWTRHRPGGLAGARQ